MICPSCIRAIAYGVSFVNQVGRNGVYFIGRESKFILMPCHKHFFNLDYASIRRFRFAQVSYPNIPHCKVYITPFVSRFPKKRRSSMIER